MKTPLRSTSDAEIDHLGLSIDGVRTLTRKFGVVAENQRDSAGSLGRAAALRSMDELNRSKHHPNSRHLHLANENTASASGSLR